MSNKIIKLITSLVFSVLILCSCSFQEAETYFSDYFNDTSTNEETTSNSNTEYDSILYCHYLNVGQGDSIFIELPNSESMLIDAGISGEGEAIENYINNLGYTQIDYLVATHPHADHIGSMEYIVENMDIGQVYMPDVSTTTKTYENLLTAISEKNLTVQSAEAGMSIYSDSDCTVDIIAPVTIDEDELNNCSIVLKIVYGNNSFLFTGDAEVDELSTITDDVSADVLKVGHHGSNTSTTKDFLEKVNPQYAVISVGTDNDYGHPHESTLELLEQFNVQTYRTDQDGTIMISSDGNKISVSTNWQSIVSE